MKATCRLHRKASNESIVSIYKTLDGSVISLSQASGQTCTFYYVILSSDQDDTLLNLPRSFYSIFSVTMDVLPLSSMVQVISVTSNWEADYNFTRKTNMRMEFSMILFFNSAPFSSARVHMQLHIQWKMERFDNFFKICSFCKLENFLMKKSLLLWGTFVEALCSEKYQSVFILRHWQPFSSKYQWTEG